MKLLRLNVVLAAIEGEESSLTVLRAASELARAAGAKLHVLHVIPQEASTGAAGETMLERRTRDVQRLVGDAGLEPKEARLHLLGGEPAYVIRSLADSIRADAIVLGRARGAIADGRALGSTALRVVTSSWAPCLVVSSAIHLPLERVLVPIDLSDTSRGALVTALSWASALRGAERPVAAAAEEPVSLTALLVQRPRPGGGDGSSARSSLDDALNWLRQDAGSWAGVGIDGVIVSGEDVPAAVADYAREHEVDLLVIGTRGLGLDAVGRLGSVALGVARRVTSPVLLVPPAVWSEHSGHR